MEWDYYKVYLGTDMASYEGPFMCETLDMVQIVLNNAQLYDRYLVIGYSKAENKDEVIAQGRIEINNNARNKKGR